jgi:long-chain acyl-CoA synthetase
LDSQGLVLHNVELRVGDAGEIQAKGPSIFNGYWKNQAQTTQAFTKNGWFKTGDIGQINDGWLQIQGRAKFAIILNSGLNVFPEDIELVAEKYRAIKEICVVGVRTRAGEIVQAVVLSDKKDKVVDKTIKEINSQLEEFQHISSWSRWPESEFPRTLILKVDRKKVQEWANQPKSDFLAPDKKLKNDDPLINILRASLDNPRAIINEKDRLSDIGIDSLRRLAVVSAIEENLGIYIPESKIDQTTTLKGLRKLVDHGNHVEVAIKRPNWQFNKFVRLVGNLLRETVVRGLLRFFVKIHVEGRENIENLESPAIYMFNHVDGFDSPVIYQALPKNIRDRLAVAAADDVLKRHKMLTFIARLSFAGYNLNRTDTILSSLEYTSELIDKGWNIAIAPEGQVSKNGRLQHFKSGTGLLAVETGVLIVPIKTFGLAGTMPLDKKWPQHFSQVTVKIGSPVVFDKSQSYKKATKKLYKIMKKM